MKGLRTRAPSELDNPRRWNRQLRPWFPVEDFQARINDRVGLNKDGRPIVRLVWGQEVTHHLFGEELPRYWLRRQGLYPKSQYWTVARWIFERRIEPEQYYDTWIANRYSLRDPSDGTNTRCGDCGSSGEPELLSGKLYCRNCAGTNINGGVVIDKGPPPTDYYVYMMDASVHEGGHDAHGWPWCCSQAFYSETQWGSPHSRCWGQYRTPNDFDLQVLLQSTRAIEADKTFDPYRQLSHSELFEIELAANKQVEQADMQLKALESEIIRENISQFIRQPHSVDYGANTAASRTPLERELSQRALSRIATIREANKGNTRKIS